MAVTWNPADKNAGITLSNGNLTATSSAGSGTVNQSVRATTAISATVKQYFELTVSGTAGAGVRPNQNDCYGIMGGAASLTDYIASTNGACFLQGGFASLPPSLLIVNGATSSFAIELSNGDAMRVAIDLVAHKVWWAINNTAWTSGATPWMGSGGTTDDPATGTGGLSISAVTGTIFPAWSSQWTGDFATINAGATAFAYAIPAGFVGMDSGGSGGATAQARALVLA